MDGTSNSTRASTRASTLTRAGLAAAAAILLALPAQASAPATAGLDIAATSEAVVQPLSPQARFESSFARFDALPAAPQPRGNVVDLAEIEPPVEIEEPAPEPGTGRSIGGGVASYYGAKFHGRRTASGERFDMNALTAAHKRLPFGSKVRVTNPSNGKSVVVRINDRGPYAHGRTIDLSKAAAQQIGIVSRGHGSVELSLID